MFRAKEIRKMAAVLRVKRRCDDEPLNALIIACKRRKTDENEQPEDSTASGPLATILKFALTVKNQVKLERIPAKYPQILSSLNYHVFPCFRNRRIMSSNT